jgi:uncharacterized protein (DUF1778 family)
MANTRNSRRISATVTPEVYQTLLQAADLMGATLNQFIVQSAYEKAQEVIEKEQLIRMISRSAFAFFEVLAHPPKPTAKLKKAAKLYQESLDTNEN